MFKMKKNDYFFIYHKKEMRKSNRQPVPNRKYIQEEAEVVVNPSKPKRMEPQQKKQKEIAPATAPIEKVLIN